MNQSCDILVAGAGVAGVPAAVTAARAGARVILVEQEAFPGGTGVSALHRYICGLYLNGREKPKETLNAGIVREITARFHELAPTNQPLPMGRVWGLPFEPAHLRTIYADLAQREPNLTVSLSSRIEAIERDGDRIASVTISSPEKSSVLNPLAVIDASGSGTVIRLSGAPFEIAPEPERQLAGLTVHLDGIDGERHMLGVKIAWRLSRLPGGELKGLPSFAGFAEGFDDHDGFMKLSLPYGAACQDNSVLSESVTRLHSILATHMPELAKSHIIGRSPVTEREGIRLAGISTLTGEDVLHARKFPDGDVKNAWPIEFWEPSETAPRYAYVPEGDYYTIPRRCLQSHAVANLFATGRCISATSRALASARVMGPCMALGEAAGKLAASFLNHHQS